MAAVASKLEVYTLHTLYTHTQSPKRYHTPKVAKMQHLTYSQKMAKLLISSSFSSYEAFQTNFLRLSEALIVVFVQIHCICHSYQLDDPRKMVL